VLELCRRYGALSMVDEAHSLGVLGARGRGIQEHFALPADAIDVKMATLSKALPSCGGVVAARQELVDFLRHNARGYVFSGALPAASLAAGEAGLRVLAAEPERLARLWHNQRRYMAGVKALGFDTLKSCTPIVPLSCRDESQTMEMARRCREQGVYVAPVIFPAVPVHAPRLRTSVTAAHSDSDIDLALKALGIAGRAAGLLR
jgi:glycine C-acetyltransferase